MLARSIGTPRWTDADSLIMDMEQSLERWTATDKAIVICQEANDNFTLNTGQFLVRNCEASIKYMQAWLDGKMEKKPLGVPPLDGSSE